MGSDHITLQDNYSKWLGRLNGRIDGRFLLENRL